MDYPHGLERLMAIYVIELHTRADRRGHAEVLALITGTRKKARDTARLDHQPQHPHGTVAERWVAP